jgi:hypothetical protein
MALLTQRLILREGPVEKALKTSPFLMVKTCVFLDVFRSASKMPCFRLLFEPIKHGVFARHSP